LHKARPGTTLYYKACTKHFPVLLCTTKLVQSPSQYYFVLQCYKACTKHFPVLLGTTKLPSTTLYYKACTKHVPVLLCTTKLAQSTSQYYFVLQSLHKVLPSTTLYYVADPVLLCTTKACTKYVPVLLCDTKFAQRKLLHAASSFAEKLLHTASFLNREAFTHRSFYTRQAFTHSKRLHTEHLHTVLLRMASVYTHGNFYTGKRLHTEKLLPQQAFTHSKLLQKQVFTQRSFLVHNLNSNCSSKAGRISTPTRKKDDFEALFKRTLKGNLLAPKLRKSADKSISQP